MTQNVPITSSLLWEPRVTKFVRFIKARASYCSRSYFERHLLLVVFSQSPLSSPSSPEVFISASCPLVLRQRSPGSPPKVPWPPARGTLIPRQRCLGPSPEDPWSPARGPLVPRQRAHGPQPEVPWSLARGPLVPRQRAPQSSFPAVARRGQGDTPLHRFE